VQTAASRHVGSLPCTACPNGQRCWRGFSKRSWHFSAAEGRRSYTQHSRCVQKRAAAVIVLRHAQFSVLQRNTADNTTTRGHHKRASSPRVSLQIPRTCSQTGSLKALLTFSVASRLQSPWCDRQSSGSCIDSSAVHTMYPTAHASFSSQRYLTIVSPSPSPSFRVPHIDPKIFKFPISPNQSDSFSALHCAVKEPPKA